MKRNKSFVNKPMLYLVSTPIGNLGEVSSRFLEVLKSVDLVAAEDTRNSLNLLHNFGINKPTFSLHEHNEREGSLVLIEKILEGKTVAYMSDAGYPGISDPGKILVEECIKVDIPVSVISGSCAFITGLVASGLPTNHFYFHGFLPSKDGDAKKELENLVGKKETVIFYESPHRINRTVQLLLNVLGNRNACIARELTKLNEEYIRGTLSELSEIDESTLKGEMVIVVEGNSNEQQIDDKKIIERYNELIKKGVTNKVSAEIVGEEFAINKNYVKSLTMSKK